MFAGGVSLAPMLKSYNANRLIFFFVLLQKFMMKDLILSEVKSASLKWALDASQRNSRLR